MQHLYKTILFLSIIFSSAQMGAQTIIADAGPDQNLQCNLLVATLGTDSTSMGPEFEYLWTYFGDNVGMEPFIDISNSGPYILTVTDTTTNEMASDTVNVTVSFEFIGVGLTGGDNLNCATPSTTIIAFTELFYFADFSILWTTDSGNITSDPTQASIEVDQVGSYTVVVTNLESGCTGTESIQVNSEEEMPFISIASPDILTCNFPTTTLDATGSSVGSEFEYVWIAPTGSIVGNELVVEVDFCGTYQLEVINVNTGCVSTQFVTVECDSTDPNVSIETSNILITGQQIELIGSSFLGEFAAYEWTTTNGNILGSSNGMTATIDLSGEYCLTVTNVENGCQSTECVFVEEVNASAVVADAGPDQELTCINNTVFTLGGPNTSVGGSICYEWRNENTSEIISDSITVVVFEPSLYVLTVLDKSTGEMAMDTVQFLENLIIPSIDITAPEVLTCTVTEVLLDANVSPGALLQWTSEDGTLLSTDEDIFVSTPGVYTLEATDPSNGCSTLIQVLVSEDIEIINVDAGPDVDIGCQILPVILEGMVQSSSGNYEYSWATNDGCIENMTGISIFISCAGTYDFIVTDLDSGCESSDAVVVTQSDMLLMDIQILNVSCNGGSDGSATVTVTGGTPPYTYSGLSFPNIEPLSAGSYTIVVIDANGCSTEANFVIDEPDLIPLQFVITAEGFLEVIGGGLPPYTYDWNVEVDSSVVFEPVNGTEYTVTVTDANGCAQTGSFIYEVNAVFSPSAKSINVFPNPANEQITISIDEVKITSVNALQIFDIYGRDMHLKELNHSVDGIVVDVSHFHSGTYLLHMLIDEELYVQKLIVH